VTAARRMACALACASLLSVSGCGGGSKGTVAGLPLWQRLIEGGELKGYDAQMQPPAMLNLAQFIRQADTSFVAATDASARKELTNDGFRQAMIEVFPGSSPKAPLVASTVIWVGSPARAQRLVDWSTNDFLQPCPGNCTAAWNPIKVSGVPGAKGAYRHNRLAGVRPFESYDIAFADGSFVYDLFVTAHKPGTFNQHDLLNAVRAQYKRVKGAPLPRYLVFGKRGPPAKKP
jgi:hypothetical protein